MSEKSYSIPAGLLKKWIHPKTGEVRIYVNIPFAGKIWIIQDGSSPTGDYQVRDEKKWNRHSVDSENLFLRKIGIGMPQFVTVGELPSFTDLEAAAL